MDKPHVAVVMSTYNGEKYIKEQIDSILMQEGVDVRLYVRDDGSSDKTCCIINGYHDDRVVLINDCKNIGIGRSFFTALFYALDHDSDADFFAFSDQDDIWLKNKLLTSVDTIKGIDAPALYCSDYMILRDGVNEGLFLKDIQPLEYALDVINKNTIYGCTMCFNRALAQTLSQIPLPGLDILNTRYHDTWTCLVAIACATIKYDQSSGILHRIHFKNVHGEGEPSLFVKLWRTIWLFVSKFFKLLAFRISFATFKTDIVNYCYRIGVGYVKRTSDYFLKSLSFYQKSDLAYIKMLANYRNSIKDRFTLIKNASFCKRKDESKMFFIFKVLTNLI
ncbi:MAG: glycosyltransferase [Bacteroidales bacterium]|nr:glycosyltransferase [Bacteroidales bacterium]